MTEPSHGGRHTLLGVGLILIGALAVAFMPSGAKLAYEAQSNALTVLVLRGLVGVLLLGIGVQILRGSLRLPRRLIGRVLATGLAATLLSYGFYAAIERIAISLAILITIIALVFIGEFFSHWVRKRLR